MNVNQLDLAEKMRKEKLQKNLMNNIHNYKEKKQKNKYLRQKLAKENFQKKNKTHKTSTEPIGIAAHKDRERRTIIRTKMSNSFLCDINEAGISCIDLPLMSNKKTNEDIDGGIFLAISTLVSDEMPVVSISKVLQYFLSYYNSGDKMDFRMSIDRLVNKGKIFRYGNNISLKSIK